jgi:hypothetical protein
MLDEVAIQQTLNRYTQGASGRDWSQVLSTFTPDGVWEAGGMRFEGQAAMGAAMPAFVAEFDYFVQANAPAVITVDGDKATAHSVIRECGKYAGADEILEVLGTYSDELVRTAEGWKFTRRTFATLGAHSLPLLPAVRMPGAGPRV